MNVNGKSPDTNESATQTDNDAVLEAVSELQDKLLAIETAINEPKNGIAEQLAKTTAKLQDLYSDIHGKVSGVFVRLDQISKTAQDNLNKITQMEASQKRISTILDDNKRLMRELQVMQGLVQKLTQQATTTSNQLLDVTKRGMEQNLIIHGIDDGLETSDPRLPTPMYTAKERCKYATLDFLREVLKVDLSIEDIWKAHRTGPTKTGKV